MDKTNQMSRFEIEVFEQTSDYVELRLSDGTGATRKTRGLDRAAVEELAAAVGEVYGPDALPHRVFGSKQLRELGERLFGFLDGQERWLGPVVASPQGAVVRISAQERLRHLPWELLAEAAPRGYLAVREPGPLLPVRAAATVAAAPDPVVGNRPLRVLFMATSPEGVEPELGFEAEEAAVLEATALTGTELVVEESGTLDGLRFTAEAYGAGYFDVLHLSGHATIDQGEPRFVVENELGRPVLAGADDIARAMAGQWPRLVFVSGCLTAGAPAAGVVPSMSESLVKAGAPTVLGWALRVGDVSATEFAAHLYRALAAGRPLDRAITEARRALHQQGSPAWHLLRVYADPSPLGPMVTPLHTPRRERIRVRAAAQVFLDPQTRLSRVAARAEFVGRRRVIQRCLRTLKQPLGQPGAVQGLVVQGLGGLGKSTLASRLLERMPTHQRAVWYGRLDWTKFQELPDKVTFPNPGGADAQAETRKVLAAEDLSLTARLKHVLDGPLGNVPCLFVFDDFEHNLDERDGGHVLSEAMTEILPALLQAIEETNSPSRVIITSRYRFPTPTGTALHVESLETFKDVEQTKKLANLPNLRPGAPTDPAVRQRAISAAAGNPRLMDWLNLVIIDTTLDLDTLISAIEGKADEFREQIFAQELLNTQPADLQMMLAKINVIELPVPGDTVHAVHDHPDITTHMSRATALGLLEAGTDPETNQPRYYVSNVLRPLLRPLLSDEAYTDACAAAARSLYTAWISPQLPDADSDTSADADAHDHEPGGNPSDADTNGSPS